MPSDTRIKSFSRAWHHYLKLRLCHYKWKKRASYVNVSISQNNSIFFTRNHHTRFFFQHLRLVMSREVKNTVTGLAFLSKMIWLIIFTHSPLTFRIFSLLYVPVTTCWQNDVFKHRSDMHNPSVFPVIHNLWF